MSATLNSYLLSIVIPTKNRHKYLMKLILLVDSYGLENIEIVIQDNSANNKDFIRFLCLNNKDYIKYFYVEDSISVTKNVDLAINNASGEYICLIGDDDGFLPNIIDCVRWMKQQGIEAIQTSIVVFNWPDYYGNIDSEIGGDLTFGRFQVNMSSIDCEASLRNLANRGFKHISDIPKMYQAIVKRSCLDEIYDIGQTYCPGPSPDMANAVALALIIKKFVIVDIPVIIVGQSINVGGGEKFLNGRVLDLNDVKFLPADTKKNWNTRIPKVWCSQTIWPESAIKAIEYMEREDDIFVNYEYILAWFIETHPNESKLAFNLSNNLPRLYLYVMYYKVVSPAIFLLKNLTNKIFSSRKLQHKQITVYKINNIGEAVNYLQNNFSELMRFSDFRQ